MSLIWNGETTSGVVVLCVLYIFCCMWNSCETGDMYRIIEIWTREKEGRYGSKYIYTHQSRGSISRTPNSERCLIIFAMLPECRILVVSLTSYYAKESPQEWSGTKPKITTT